MAARADHSRKRSRQLALASADNCDGHPCLESQSFVEPRQSGRVASKPNPVHPGI
jgi:hypothetical protein